MRLLIIGCSKTKSAQPGLIPAQERYAGTNWKVIQRVLRDCPHLAQSLDILVISAEFGAISSQQAIEHYDRRMDRRRAEELRPQVVAAINAQFAKHAYDDILICLGATYRLAIAGAHLDTAHQTIGGIGQQAGQLKTWLRTPIPRKRDAP